MPIPTSAEFQEVVAGSHVAKHRLDVEVAGAIVDTLTNFTQGSVTVDNAQSIRRHCSFKVVSEDYTLQSAAERFNPLAGTVLKPWSGVEIPSVQRLSIVVDTQAQWDDPTATLTDITVNPDGSISIT